MLRIFKSISSDTLEIKSTLANNLAVTVGGTIGSFVIVVIGVILAFFAVRYESNLQSLKH